MKRIETPDGQFVDGTRRVPGTPVPAWWLNGLQGELANVIESAGIELDKGKTDQLLDALRAWIAKDASANIESVASLKQMQATPGMIVQVKGYHAGTTIGGGLFAAIATDGVSSKIDDGIYILGNGIAWLRMCDDVRPEYFGARGDGIADDTAILVKSINFAKQTGSTLRGMAKYKVSDLVNMRAIPVDMATAEIHLVGSGQVIIGGLAGNSFNPNQSFGRVLKGPVKFDPKAYTEPSIKCIGAKGQNISIKYTDYLLFWQSTDPATYPHDASQAYNTFNIGFSIKIDVDTDPRYANGAVTDGAGSSMQWFNENILNLNRCYGFRFGGSYRHNCNRIVGGSFETQASYIDVDKGNKNKFTNTRLENVGSVRFGPETEGNVLERTYFGSVSGLPIKVIDEGVINRIETEVLERSNCTRIFEINPFSVRYNGYSDINRFCQVSRVIRPTVNYGRIAKTEKIKIEGKKDILIFDFDGAEIKSKYAIDIEIYDKSGKRIDANQIAYSSGFLTPRDNGNFSGAPIANDYYGQHRFMVMTPGDFWLTVTLSASNSFLECKSRNFAIDIYSKRPNRQISLEKAVPSSRPTQYIGFQGDLIRYKSGTAFVDVHIQTTVSSFGDDYIVIKRDALGSTVLQVGDIVGVEGLSGDVYWGSAATVDGERINLGTSIPDWLAIGDDVYITRLTTV